MFYLFSSNISNRGEPNHYNQSNNIVQHQKVELAPSNNHHEHRNNGESEYSQYNSGPLAKSNGHSPYTADVSTLQTLSSLPTATGLSTGNWFFPQIFFIRENIQM